MPHPTRASASGPIPYRALVVDAAGLLTEHAALTGAIAQQLAARTGHGVDVEVVAAAEATAAALPEHRDLSRVDTVITVLGTREGIGPDRGTVRGALEALTRRLTVGAALVVVVPAGAPSDAAALARLATDAREAADTLTPVVRLEDAEPGDRIVRWAGAVAEATAAALIEPMVCFLPDDHYDEDLRLDAIDRLPPRDDLWVARFEQIVADARAAYGTASAALSIVDADHANYSIRIGLDTPVIRRGRTLCNRALRTYGGLIVGDAQDDLRFQGFPAVRSGALRFWAGHRIESEDGAPLGTLCVFDAEPREVDEADLVALRDLAVALQHSLWDLQRVSTQA